MRAKLQTALERLRALPWYFRLLVRISLLSLYALGPAITLCYWLTVGFVTEAWPWVLWGETYLQIAEQMRTTGRPITYFLLLVIGWWLLGLVIEPPWKIKRPSLRLALLGPRVVYATVIALCLAAVLPLLVVNSVRVVRTWPPRTNHLLLENCGHCHSPYRPQHYIKSADMWQRTVRRMIERNGAPVSDEKAEKIIAWLQDYRGFSDSWMFRAKCLRCHGKSHLMETPRTAEEWSFTVDRMAWLSPFAYREDQRKQVKQHLASELSVEPPPQGSPERAALDARLGLQKACNPCHSLSLVLEEGAMDEPRAMVKRMSEKNPSFIPPDKIDQIVEWLEMVPTEEEAFWSMFPHDILLDLE